MKIGEQYYCIKNRYDKNYNLIHEEGKTYKVLIIDGNTVVLETEKYNSNDSYFYVVDDTKGFYYYYFYTHFITKQQSRKNKLKQLYESNL